MKLYPIIAVFCAFCGGYLHGEDTGVKRMRIQYAHERVSEFVRGETAWVSQEHLDLVSPELKEAALRR